MPWGDWQFWVVTALFIAAMYFVIRPFLPRRRARSTRVSLTIDRKPRR